MTKNAITNPDHPSIKKAEDSFTLNPTKFNDFLNPRSMMTPGIAGSFVMVIANTLWVEFLLPQKWSALALSFLVIIPILVKFAATFLENIIYFIFNGLIVFAMAVNTNFAGRTIKDITLNPKAPITSQVPSALENSVGAIDANSYRKIKIHFAENKVKPMQVVAQTTLRDQEKKSAISNKAAEKDNKSEKEQQKKEDPEFFDKWF